MYTFKTNSEYSYSIFHDSRRSQTKPIALPNWCGYSRWLGWLAVVWPQVVSHHQTLASSCPSTLLIVIFDCAVRFLLLLLWLLLDRLPRAFDVFPQNQNRTVTIKVFMCLCQSRWWSAIELTAKINRLESNCNKDNEINKNDSN